MIYVDENLPLGDEAPQFTHRHVAVQRPRDVHTDFEMLEEIGRGKFGRVMRCKHWETGSYFAAKFVQYTRKEDRENVEREVQIMNTLAHPKLLFLYDAYDNCRNEMCLVTEYIPGGELFDRVIEDEFVLTEKACICFMRQILEGVSFMHSKNILHLDLKPENILCLTKSGNRIKIIDFGLARIHEPAKKLQVLFGTPEFVAPEVVNFEPISFATDMWAVGVITYVLLSGLSPFMGDTDLETMANVTIAEYDYEDEAFNNISATAKDFIDKLLVKKKESRLTAESCLNHTWISSLTAAQDKDLSATKQNLKSVPSNNNYYIFDASTKTISVASNHEEEVHDEDYEWEWDEEEDLGTELQTTNAETIFAQKKSSIDSSNLITQQNIQNMVNEIKTEMPPVFGKKRRSDDCSVESESKQSQGTNTENTATKIHQPPQATVEQNVEECPLNKVSKTNQEMFSSSLQCLVDLANSVSGDGGADGEEVAKAANISLSDLVREANEKIRFSIHFDARKNQQMQANKFLNVKEDLHKVKQDIQGLKNDLKSAEKPLMDILNFLDEPTVSNSKSTELTSACLKKDTFLLETEAELEKLTRTMTTFQPVAPPRKLSSQKISFGSAQTGNVSQAKKLFEKKCDEEVENLLNSVQNPSYYPQQYQRPIATPTNSNSTRATPLSMRRRSPSPVVTGNVSRARMRFESGGSVKTTPLSHLENTEQFTSNNHQTLPRTFRWNNSNCMLTSTNEKSAINRFLSGSSNALSNHSPTPPSWTNYKAQHQQNMVGFDSPLLGPRKRFESMESAAKFLSETLPCNSLTSNQKINFAACSSNPLTTPSGKVYGKLNHFSSLSIPSSATDAASTTTQRGAVTSCTTSNKFAVGNHFANSFRRM